MVIMRRCEIAKFPGLRGFFGAIWLVLKPGSLRVTAISI